MVAAGFDDNNDIKWTTQVKKVCFEKKSRATRL